MAVGILSCQSIYTTVSTLQGKQTFSTMMFKTKSLNYWRDALHDSVRYGTVVAFKVIMKLYTYLLTLIGDRH